MKLKIFIFLIALSANLIAQKGKIGPDFFKKIEKEGLSYYKNSKKKKSIKKYPAKYLPKDKSIVYNGKNLQMILLGFSTLTNVPSTGTQKKSTFSFLYVKKTNEDLFTYIGYYPGRRDEISVVPFKKHAALYLKDYQELSEKVSKKKKGYTRYDAVSVFKEYDAWLSKL